MEEPPAAVDKAFQQFFRIDVRLRAPLIKPGFRTRDLFRARHPEQGQIIDAFAPRAFLAALPAPLAIAHRRHGVGAILARLHYRGHTLPPADTRTSTHIPPPALLHPTRPPNTSCPRP